MANRPNPLDPSTQVQACIDLAKLSADRFDQRRSYEWKVTVGFWAVIVAAIVQGSAVSLPKGVGWIALAAYAFIWLRGVWVANDNDKQCSFHWQAQAEFLLQAQTAINPAPAWIRSNWKWLWSNTDGARWKKLRKWCFGFITSWSTAFQLVATAFLVWAFEAARR